jgi:hypothetical protein
MRVIQSDAPTRVAKAILANFVVFVGVVVLEWSVGALLVIYWVEAAVVTVRGAVQGLFAQHQPEDTAITSLPGQSWDEKRGGVSFGPFPPVYPRNIHVVLSGLFAMLIFWPIAGSIVVVAVESSSGGIPAGSLALAVFGVIASHVIGIGEYFWTTQYADWSVRSAMSGSYVLGVFVLGIGGLYALDAIGQTAPVGILIVATTVKLLVDLSRGALGFGLGSSLSPADWADESVERQVPDGDPIAVFETDRRSLLIRAPGLTPLILIAPPYAILPLFAGVIGLFVSTQAGVVTLSAATALVAGGRVIGVDVERGHLEYQVYPHQIVAYDTLLETPQWTVQRKTIEKIAINSSICDLIRPGAPTVIISTYGDDRRLYALACPRGLVNIMRDEDR